MCHAHSDYKRPSLHTAAHYEFSSCSVLYISTSKYSLSRMETNKSRMAVWGIRNGQICLRMHTFPCGTWRLPGAAPGSTAVCKQHHGCCTLINDRGRLSPFPKEGMQRRLRNAETQVRLEEFRKQGPEETAAASTSSWAGENYRDLHTLFNFPALLHKRQGYQIRWACSHSCSTPLWIHHFWSYCIS